MGKTVHSKDRSKVPAAFFVAFSDCSVTAQDGIECCGCSNFPLGTGVSAQLTHPVSYHAGIFQPSFVA
jgi:hypothetical protein